MNIIVDKPLTKIISTTLDGNNHIKLKLQVDFSKIFALLELQDIEAVSDLYSSLRYTLKATKKDGTVLDTLVTNIYYSSFVTEIDFGVVYSNLEDDLIKLEIMVSPQAMEVTYKSNNVVTSGILIINDLCSKFSLFYPRLKFIGIYTKLLSYIPGANRIYNLGYSIKTFIKSFIPKLVELYFFGKQKQNSSTIDLYPINNSLAFVNSMYDIALDNSIEAYNIAYILSLPVSTFNKVKYILEFYYGPQNWNDPGILYDPSTFITNSLSDRAYLYIYPSAVQGNYIYGSNQIANSFFFNLKNKFMSTKDPEFVCSIILKVLNQRCTIRFSA